MNTDATTQPAQSNNLDLSAPQPKAGDKVIMLRSEKRLADGFHFKEGDLVTLTSIDKGGDWWADCNPHPFDGHKNWCVGKLGIDFAIENSEGQS